MSDNNPYGLPPVPPPNPYSGQPQANPFGAPPQANPYNQGGYAPPGAPAPQAPNPFANPYNQGGQPPPSTGGGYNPYAPPSFDGPSWAQGFDNEPVLATPGSRLGARMLDGLLYIPALIPMFIGAAANSEELALGLGGIAMLAVAIYQWYLESTTGQTLGKKWMGIRVVKMDGSPVDFVSAVVLRRWVLQVVSAIIGLVGLIDALMVFTEQHRCLHDHIAGTKVIVA